MAEPFARRKSGDPVLHSAAETNAFIDAALAHRDRERSIRTPPGSRLPWGMVYVRNNSGADRDVWDVLAFSGPEFADGTAPGFQQVPAFVGVTPDPENNPAHRSRVCILAEPIAAGATGRAYIAGQIAMPLDVIDAAHTRARVLDDCTLQSGYFGPVRILACESSPADPEKTWCRVDIDSHDGGHCFVRVPASGIAGGAWTLPMATTCVLAWPHAITSAATDVPAGKKREVKVFHYGPEIEPIDGGSKYVQCRLVSGRIVPDVEYCDY